MGTIILVLFFGISLLYPIFFLLQSAFTSSSGSSLRSFSLLFDNPRLLDALNNSITIAAGTVVVSLVVGIFLSVALTRIEFRLKKFFEILILLPLFLPPFVGVLGIRQMLGRFGIVNAVGEFIGFSNVDYLGSLPAFGIILIQSFHFFPLVYLYISSALIGFNYGFEEAAFSVGAKGARTFLHITLPLILPSIIASSLLIFMGSFTDVGTPLLFEFRSAVPVVVMTMMTELKTSGAAYALVLVIATFSVGLFLLARLAEKGRAYEMFQRGSVRRRPVPVSGQREFLFTVAILSILLLSILPHLGIFLMSFGDRWFMTPLPERLTLQHIQEVFVHPVALGSIQYSFLLSIGAMIVCSGLGFVLSWKIVRGDKSWRAVWEGMAMLPLALPGIVIAYGLVTGYAGTWIDPRKNPTFLLILAYSVRKLPYMVKMLNTGIQYCSIDLEDAARTVGAGNRVIFRRIMLPLLKPQLIAGAVLVFIGSFLEVSDSLLLTFEEKFFPLAKALYALQNRPDGYPIACAMALVVMIFISIGLWLASTISGKKVSSLLQG